MAFTRPTLSALIARVQGDFVSRLELSVPILRRSMIYALSRVLAGTAHLMHGYLEYLSKQIFPDQSDEEYLIRQGAIYGLSKTAAAYATGDIVATGTNGSVIPAGSVLKHEDGTTYTTDAEARIATGEATITVTAEVAGEDGNRDAAVELSFESPITGVDATADVDTGGLVSGSDEETTEAFRTRVLARIQSPPHGGSKDDYIAWAKEVSGVTRAWCVPLDDGPGTVTVYFVRDNDASLIPDAGEITAVQNYIDASSRKPVTADVTVKAPTPVELDFTISVTPNTTAVKAAVEAELEDLLLDASPGSTVLLSKVRTAIGTASGVTDYSLTSPTTDTVHDPDELAIMGDITWA